MMLKPKSMALAVGAIAAITAAVALGPVAALAQNDRDPLDAYRAGVDLGRTLHDPRECEGSGDYRDGCVDGVEESGLERQAEQALDSTTDDAKPAEHPPLLSPPPGLFPEPFSKPVDVGPPNN